MIEDVYLIVPFCFDFVCGSSGTPISLLCFGFLLSLIHRPSKLFVCVSVVFVRV